MREEGVSPRFKANDAAIVAAIIVAVAAPLIVFFNPTFALQLFLILFVSALYVAWGLRDTDRRGAALSVTIAILYNPIIPLRVILQFIILKCVQFIGILPPEVTFQQRARIAAQVLELVVAATFVIILRTFRKNNRSLRY